MAEEPNLLGNQRAFDGGDEVGVKTHFQIKSEGLNEVQTAVKGIADEWKRLNEAIKATDHRKIQDVMGALGMAGQGAGGSNINPGAPRPADPFAVPVGEGDRYGGERARLREAGEDRPVNGGDVGFSSRRGERQERGASGAEPPDQGNGGLFQGASGMAIGAAGAAAAAVPGFWIQNQAMHMQLGQYGARTAQANGGSVAFNGREGMQGALESFSERYFDDRPGFAVNREDALATASMIEPRYGAVGSQTQNAALAAQGTLAGTTMISGQESAQMINELMAPRITNMLRGMGIDPLRGQGGEARPLGEFTEDLFGRMNASGDDLMYNAPGEKLYENFRYLGIDPETTGQRLIEVQQANENFQRLQRTGELDRSLGRTITEENVDEYREAGGLENAYTSRIELEQRRSDIATDIFGEGQAQLVQTNDWLATMTSHTEGILKAVTPLGAGLGTIAAEIPLLGRVISDPVNSLLAAIVAKDHLFGGGGLGGGGRGGAGRGGMLGRLGRAGRFLGRGAGGLGAGMVAGQVIDSMIGNPEDPDAFDGGNVLRYGAMGAGAGAMVGGPVGAAIGGGVGLVGGVLKETFFGDPVEGGEVKKGPPSIEIREHQTGDPVQDDTAGMTLGAAISYIKEESPKRGGKGGSHIDGLRPQLAIPLAKMMRANPRLSVTSGYRSPAAQETIYRDRYRPPYPGAPIQADGWVHVKGAPAAKPGRSNHQHGLAVDLNETGWLARNARNYGLVLPMDYEPWHWEPPNAKGLRDSDPNEYVDPGAPADEGMADAGTPGGEGGGMTQARSGSGVNYSISAAVSAALALRSGGTSHGGGGGEAAGAAAGGAAGAGGVSVGGVIGFDDAYRLAKGAGFNHDQSIIMAAIAMGESDLDPNAQGDQHLAGRPTADGRTWGNSMGLWQIRSVREAAGTGEARDPSVLLDPNANAKAAKAVFNDQGFNAWSVYKDGIHKQYIDDVQAALRSGGGAASSAGQAPTSGEQAPSGDPVGMPNPIQFSGSGSGANVSVGRGASIYAPIQVVLKNGTDAEAIRAAETIRGHLEQLSQRDEMRSN